MLGRVRNAAGVNFWRPHAIFAVDPCIFYAFLERSSAFREGTALINEYNYI